MTICQLPSSLLVAFEACSTPSKALVSVSALNLRLLGLDFGVLLDMDVIIGLQGVDLIAIVLDTDRGFMSVFAAWQTAGVIRT